jgi:membrane protein implicated in regulation of membrane protease activity
MADSTIWWVLAGTTIAIELVSGTFYLLMLAIGFAAAALAAHTGTSIPIQVAVAAAIGGGSVVVLRHYRKVTAAKRGTANQHTNLDIGETVYVEAWSLDGTSTVKYRGANWSAALVSGATPSSGSHRIVEIVGSRLILEKL